MKIITYSFDFQATLHLGTSEKFENNLTSGVA